jgi:hypothetical protein
MPRKRIGELLVERGIISVKQLEEGLTHHRSSRQRLGATLVQKGFLTEVELAKTLADALGLPWVDLAHVLPDWVAIQHLKPRFCEVNDLFPFAQETVRNRINLHVAMADPLNLAAVDEMEFTIGLKVVQHVAPLSAVRAAILRHYYKVRDSVPVSKGGTDDGKMTLIQRGGGGEMVVDTRTGSRPVPEKKVHGASITLDEEVITGEEVTEKREITARTALAQLIEEREAQRRAKRTQGMDKDFEYLFGATLEEDRIEKLERKFWALMRIMARKGMLTQKEFTEEMGAFEDDEAPPATPKP